MNSTSYPVSKRLRTETVTDDGDKSSTADDTAVQASARSQASVSEDAASSFVTVFTDDILPVIFQNPEILTAQDLLNFRLVNRCWRDAATLVLLKQSMCEIHLAFGKVNYDEDGNSVAQIRRRNLNRKSLRSFNYFNFRQPRSFLVDLSQLISTSAKFPSNIIRFHSDCGWGFGDLVPPGQFNKDDDHKIDLFHFFYLYGKKIRKLSFSSGISKQAVQNLLYIHMPHLICLDLQYFEEFDGDFELMLKEGSPTQVCRPLPLTLEIKEIIVGDDHTTDKYTFLKELISFCPNLSALKQIKTTSLGVLLELKKFHLVQDFVFHPNFLEKSITPKFAKFLTNTILDKTLPRLNLNKLTAQLHFVCNSGGYEGVVELVNLLLSASNDCLRCLTIDMKTTRLSVNIFIPPLPHLKFLMLDDYNVSATTTTQFHFFGDVMGGRLRKQGEVIFGESFDNLVALALQNKGKSNISSEYFPRLGEVKLSIGGMRNNSDKLVQFFSMDHLGPDKVTTIYGDTLEAVTTLEWMTYSLLDRNMSNIFPNVSQLKFVYIFSMPQNWYWDAFPKLERLEISGQVNCWQENIADSFFTGISQELCSQLKSDATFGLKTAPSKGLKRTMPYIGDCENLKELKINFKGKLRSKFASPVAAIYGFEEVIHRTKIIFSFENVSLSVEEIEETRRNLDHLSAYVEIRIK